MQTASAFENVQRAFSFFITAYTQLAEWRAVTQRLIGFEDSMSTAERMKNESGVRVEESAKAAISLDELRLRLPSGVPLVLADDVEIQPGERVLVSGRSGSGKSTLFRAIAGIWPFGDGKIQIAKGKKLLVLPQRPYLPFSRLDEALAYPGAANMFGAQQLADVLKAVGLEKLVDRLDEEASWPHILSQGEQQRLSLARAILSKPDILLLDEASSGLDEAGEAALYKLVSERLPETTIVSIGHRSTLHALHGRRLDLVPQNGGQFLVKPVVAAPG
jgi:vitamin B12/bleomycin/antimicrobial peptide transport system ATP-binding/permease protein